MGDLARFVESPGGSALFATSQMFHTDPAQGITDPVVAHNLRAGLLVTHGVPAPEPDFEEMYSVE